MASRKPAAGASVGTTRLPPLNNSRSSTPNVANAKKANAAPPAASTSNGAGPPPAPVTQKLLDKDRKMVEYSSPADKCPVCYSDRYLNPQLRLLVSKCYHKMCESCIDRLFTLGPGPCPVCGQILRKTQFSAQTYENLAVEKEVTIRKRIAKIFNKTQEDFPDLATYNNYLEEVEELTFNLINAVDVEETDRRIAAYQKENAEQIDNQSSYEERHAELVRQQDEEEKRQRAERAAEFAKQDEADRLERQKDEQAIISALETSEGSAKDVIKKQKAVALKKSSARMALEAAQPAPNTSNSKPSLLSKYAGFNRSTFSENTVEDPFKPYDPLADYDENWYDYRDLFTLRPKDRPYQDAATQAALQDPKKQAGGLDVSKSVWERAIRSAVMGLWTKPVAA